MRYSNLFGKTVKTVPRDLQAKSHQFLYQGGFIRQISAGRYAFLPLGFRVWEKIRNVIKKEMEDLGCQQVRVPTLHPLEIWQVTSRDQAFGEEMLLVEDHQGAGFVVGATAEGVMVELVKKFSLSYRDLPLLIYQFSQKFRDEKRPRGGLLRVREFMMKDAYSFCSTEEKALEIYQKFFSAYQRIAEKLDLDVIPVQSDSGALGGDYNHEFIVPSEVGEARIFVCDNCGYSASEERAEFERVDYTDKEEQLPLENVEQPAWVKTMEDNQKFYGEPLYKYLKNVVYKTPEDEIVIASVRGDQEVNEAKLARLLDVPALFPAEEEDLQKIGTKPGYVHSWGIEGVTYVGDIGLTKVHNFIGGHKEETTDTRNVNYGRDFSYELLGDIVNAYDGAPCTQCNTGNLRMQRGIELGHCFKQDHFYTGPQEGTFVNADGEEEPLWMGAYGIGLGRALATVVETHCDNKGIIWPENIAPYTVHLLTLNLENEAVEPYAEEVYKNLLSAGVEVLYDDRAQSAGEKFSDADLIGIPWRVVVSSATEGKGKVEVKRRGEDSEELMSVQELIGSVN
ncbi:MAG: proline--tRNA ligase [Patescibacteria group bacterium]